MADLRITIEYTIVLPDEVRDYDESRFAGFLDDLCDDTGFAAEARDAEVRNWTWTG